MRTLCSVQDVPWTPLPEHNTLGGLPIAVHKKIINIVLASEVMPELSDHFCNYSSPCVVLRRAMQTYASLLSVCSVWNDCLLPRKECLFHGTNRDPDSNSDPRYDSAIKAGYFGTLDGRYRGYQSIEEEYNKCVFKAYDFGGTRSCRDKTEVIIKTSTAKAQHENEIALYCRLETSDALLRDTPQLFFAGNYPHSNPLPPVHGLVMSKMGPDLERLRLKCRHKRFTPRLTLAVAVQVVSIYQRLHEKGWLHCNAKPGNFAIGPDLPGQNTRIYMFDFEFSKPIQPIPSNDNMLEGWNRKFQPVPYLVILPHFCSSTAPSIQDDLEGLGYVLCHLERGSLPWETFRGDDIWRSKISVPRKELFEGMDPVFVDYFNGVKALAWGEIPDYDGIIEAFIDVWDEKGYSATPWSIDWWEELRLKGSTAKD